MLSSSQDTEPALQCPPPTSVPPGAFTLPARLDHFLLVEELGTGGMGTVYRAEDEELNREVAIKVLRPEMSGKPEPIERFRREAQAGARLSHRHILAVYQFVGKTHTDPAYLVMELIRGTSLGKLRKDFGVVPPDVVAMIGLKLTEALTAMHSHGMIHRDVKPENVLFSRSGTLKLCDFGLAQLEAQDASITQPGKVVGTPFFMSPEQLRGQRLGPSSDIYSLGVTLYTVITGKLPYETVDGKARVRRAEPLGALEPRIPRYLERAIERCLQPQIDKRWPSVEVLGQALREGLEADGLGRVDEELSAYFAGPGTYCMGLEERLVLRSLERARQAIRRGAIGEAGWLCNRVLAWRPDNKQALRLVERIKQGGRPRRWPAMMLVLVGLLGLGAGGLFLWHRRPAKPRDSHDLAARTTRPALFQANGSHTPDASAATAHVQGKDFEPDALPMKPSATDANTSSGATSERVAPVAPVMRRPTRATGRRESSDISKKGKHQQPPLLHGNRPQVNGLDGLPPGVVTYE